VCRLELELKQVAARSLEDAFLIAWDVARFLEADGIQRGPGYSHATASLLLFALGVTDIDPVRFGLVFERFLEPAAPWRLAWGIEPGASGEIVDHLFNTLGRAHVSVVEPHPRVIEALAGSAPSWVDVALSAKTLGPPPIKCEEARYLPTVTFHDSRLAKTLRVKALREGVDLRTIPLEDERVYSLIASEGLGWLEEDSWVPGGDFIRACAPRSFGDLIALLALHRPAPLFSRVHEQYLNCRAGRDIPIHPRLESILAETFGLVLYQEQIIEVVAALTGSALDRAEATRKMLTREPLQIEELESLRAEILELSVERGWAPRDVAGVLDDLVRATRWAYPKSCALGVAMSVYWAAWFRSGATLR